MQIEKYSENFNRQLAHESQLEHGYCFSLEQVHDACEMVKNHTVPDGRFGDAECCLWEVIQGYFGKRF